MSARDVTLLGREEVASGTMAFRLSRPAGFEFRAGQSATLALAEPPPAPNSAQRIFSLASAPFESDLMVATRLRDASAFKQALKALPIGAQLRLRGPRGAMTLHEDTTRAALFIAGGIGITPFLSMLRQAAHERVSRPLFLLYSNRRPQDAAFLPELRAMAGLRLTARMTDAEGFIDQAVLQSFSREAPAPVYYLAGPPAMVEAMKALLQGMGVSDDDVRGERFYGY